MLVEQLYTILKDRFHQLSRNLIIVASKILKTYILFEILKFYLKFLSNKVVFIYIF